MQTVCLSLDDVHTIDRPNPIFISKSSVVKLLLAFGRVIERRQGGGEGAAIIPSKSPYHLISMR
eukprot:1173881-Amorphochlora_amoeboformis.AAC.1